MEHLTTSERDKRHGEDATNSKITIEIEARSGYNLKRNGWRMREVQYSLL